MGKLVMPEANDWVLSFLEGLSCPRALTVAILYREGMIGAIQSLDCPPVHYDDADAYRRAIAATKLLSKVVTPCEGMDPVKSAFETWQAAEKQCFSTNQMINEMLDFGTHCGVPVPKAVEFFDSLRESVIYLIGNAPPRNIAGTFGPGATLSDISARTTVPHKMSSEPTMTTSSWPYLVDWMSTRWASACADRGDLVQEVSGNRYFQVPKNAKTNRSCAVEPSINAYYQRAYGEILARRLERRGFSFKAAKDIHTRVACEASKNGSFATLDLKSASDTVASALVKAALPTEWYNALNMLRSPRTFIPKSIDTPLAGHDLRLEKFSSMGNGFTFELEMTLFTAIILTVCPELRIGRDLWVWGDDIIVPTSCSEIVKKALRFCGFTVNKEKSFEQGPFRESCGGDFWDGQAVRPYYLKEFPHEPQEYIAVANGIRRLGSADSSPFGLSADLRRSWFRCLDYLPSNIRKCRGPVALGDLVIHDDERRWSVRLRSCIRYLQVYRPCSFETVSFDRFDPWVQEAAALYGVALLPCGTPQTKTGNPTTYPSWYTRTDGDRRRLTLRGKPLSYKVGWTAYS